MKHALPYQLTALGWVKDLLYLSALLLPLHFANTT